jgi:hypothetical protein
MLNQWGTIKGTKGYVTVDNLDGTYTVNLVDNTIYFATEEELKPKQTQVEDSNFVIYTILDEAESRWLENQLIGNLYRKEKNGTAYRNTVRFLKKFGINAHKKDKWEVLCLLTDLMRESTTFKIKETSKQLGII